MNKFCVFAGTNEGRRLVEFLLARGANVTACVATDYGQTLLPEHKNLSVSARKLPEEEIRALLRAERFDLVVDATHPYAVHITESVAAACAAEGVECLRLLREEGALPAGAVWVESPEAAAAWLRETAGNILLTTGSKDLARYAALPDFAARVYARVLPMAESLALCQKAGLPPSHILAMQGPFSAELNAAMIRAVNAAFVVTKASGAAGGFAEKAAAAEECGAALLVIGRPPQREGLGYEATVKLLCERFAPAPPAEGSICTPGLPDEAFRRLEGLPMTKSEVRAVILSKLRLTRESLCWDIGAGTGSVAVEMALQAARGTVYAVERRADAAALIAENARRLGAGNLTVVTGEAPAALEALPAPSHAFIGGSGGRMAEILAALLAKNPRVRIVAAAVTLETAAELTACLRRFAFAEPEIVTVQFSRARAAGDYHLLRSQDPVTLFTLQGRGEP